MLTPSVKKVRKTRAASKTQLGEVWLGGFLHSRKPPGIFPLKQSLAPPSKSLLLANSGQVARFRLRSPRTSSC